MRHLTFPREEHILRAFELNFYIPSYVVTMYVLLSKDFYNVVGDNWVLSDLPEKFKFKKPFLTLKSCLVNLQFSLGAEFIELA